MTKMTNMGTKNLFSHEEGIKFSFHPHSSPPVLPLLTYCYQLPLLFCANNRPKSFFLSPSIETERARECRWCPCPSITTILQSLIQTKNPTEQIYATAASPFYPRQSDLSHGSITQRVVVDAQQPHSHPSIRHKILPKSLSHWFVVVLVVVFFPPSAFYSFG